MIYESPRFDFMPKDMCGENIVYPPALPYLTFTHGKLKFCPNFWIIINYNNCLSRHRMQKFLTPGILSDSMKRKVFEGWRDKYQECHKKLVEISSATVAKKWDRVRTNVKVETRNDKVVAVVAVLAPRSSLLAPRSSLLAPRSSGCSLTL